MSELIIKDICPHCGKKTIVYLEKRGEKNEKKNGSMIFSGCQHCDKTLGDLPWKKREWFVARLLKPKEAE